MDSGDCFCRLRQLRRMRRSLDDETLVRVFVTFRIDYCNSVLASDPKDLTDKLQRVLNAAARVTSDTGKRSRYDPGPSQLLHEKLHRLDVRNRVTFKLVVTVMVHRCLNGWAP